MLRDEDCIRRCLTLAADSQAAGDLPFGAVIVDGQGRVFEALNTGLSDITGHAEVNVMREFLKDPLAQPGLVTLYTNFEPCPMCAFLIRDYGIGRVVWALESPYWGGYTRWDILQDTRLRDHFTTYGDSRPPQVVAGVLRAEAAKIFDDLDWEMHGYDHRATP